MRKVLLISTVIAITLCVMAQYRGISLAGPTGVVGSNHDLSIYYSHAEFTGNDTGGPYRYETDEVCIFCHTPHGANAGVREDTYWDGSAFTNDPGASGGSSVMLWNRSLDMNKGGAGETTSMLTYNSPTMDGATGEVWAYSLMCLSCHDGVQALNVLLNNPFDWDTGPIDPDGGSGPTRLGFVNNVAANIGERQFGKADDDISHLENDHPISIDYQGSRSADAGLRLEGAGIVTDGTNTVRLFPKPDGALLALECSTCHDVHNEGSKEATAPLSVRFKYPFLAVTSQGSALCVVCHKK